MALQTIIVTGSAGLVGSECVRFFAGKGYRVIGIDNDERLSLFGSSTVDNLMQLMGSVPSYVHYHEDITHPGYVRRVFEPFGYDTAAVIHCAAQPSHDWAASNPVRDFEINASGTLHLLEATRKYCPHASFVFMSTNKIYGDRPNVPPFRDDGARLEPCGVLRDDDSDDNSDNWKAIFADGIDETMPVDQCTHSLFGCSKLAADLYVQEYGRYFGMNTVCFRGGCLTGPAHAGAKLHGFLSYLVKCAVENIPYQVIGYGGKQVRDNIHSADLVAAFWEYIQAPTPGAVYNIGGGRENSCSVLEAIAMVEELTGRKMQVEFVDEPRKGDHKWWITDTSKFQRDYPNWKQRYTLRQTLAEMVEAAKWKAA